jgi:hypothetical protein
VNQPTGVNVPSNQMTASATNGVRELAGGASGTSWVISTAVRPDDYLDWYNGYNNTVVHTLVTVAQKS